MKPPDDMGPLDRRVLAAVTSRPLCLEEIVERSGLPVTAVVVALERLEERGALRGEAGWWARGRLNAR
jgi:predicted Rossmann fold nucleotide-binding protein DprA/Smf involved in DNA uptake